MREPSQNLALPLPLAELLHVCLGALTEALIEEDHRWVPLMKMVLKSYADGRDDILTKMYGDHVVMDVDLITYLVSEELCKWATDLAGEETDFQKWAEELNREKE